MTQIVTANLYFDRNYPELSSNVMELEQQSRKAWAFRMSLWWMWHLHEMKSTHGKWICSHFLFHSFPQHLKASMDGAQSVKTNPGLKDSKLSLLILGAPNIMFAGTGAAEVLRSQHVLNGETTKNPLHSTEKKQASPSRWLNLPVEDCTERHTFAFFLKMSSPFFLGSKNHPWKILSRAPLRGVAMAVFLLDW